MDNNDTHLKSPQTGGLKLMTVFIVVLALHVVVIGGFTVYHLMSGGGDTDLVGDKTHKGVKIATDADATAPDGTASPDKTAAANPAATPAPDATASTEPTDTSAPGESGAPATTVSASVTPAPEASAPTPALVPDATTMAATPAPAPASTASTPSGAMVSGPVMTPPPETAPMQNDATAEEEAIAPPAPDAGIAPAIPYTVKLHDSLAKIAHRNHIAVARLRETNNLKTDLLHVGQKLMIPSATQVAANEPEKTPAASHGPNRTLLGDSIPDEPSKKTVSSTTHDEALVMPATSGHHTYTVVKGDTLLRIAHKFHTTTSALMAANGSIESRKLRIGQKLHIPSQGARSANIAPVAQPLAQPETPRPQPEPAEIQPMATPSAQLANFMP
jgi:LysM repeat protein